MIKELIATIHAPASEIVFWLDYLNRRFIIVPWRAWVDDNYYGILSTARERAKGTPSGIELITFHNGQGYKVDVAYSEEHST